MYCIVTGSCRPFQRSAQLQFEFPVHDILRDDDDEYPFIHDARGMYKQPE